MEILKITAADLDKDGFYIGQADATNFAGHIEIAADLGWVRFKAALRAAGYIRALAGSGIKAGEGIEAGWGIKAGSGIKAGDGIKAGGGIEAGEGTGIFAGLRVRIADWSRYAQVVARSKPNSLISGAWIEPAAESKKVEA